MLPSLIPTPPITLGTTPLPFGQTTTSVAGMSSISTSAATVGGEADANTLHLTPSANSTGVLLAGGSHSGSDATSDVSLATTLNTSGSPDVFKLSATVMAAGASTKLLNLYGGASGTTSIFSVDLSGNLRIGSATGPQILPNAGGAGRLIFQNGSTTKYLYMSDGDNALITSGTFAWAWSTNPGTTSPDLFLTRSSVATLHLGAADAASPVAQTLGVQGVVTGTSNTAGANWTLAGSQGTGTGAGGSLIFKVAPAGSTGSSQNALATALTIDSTKLATFAGSITTSGNITVGSGVSQVVGVGATGGDLYLLNGGSNRNMVLSSDNLIIESYNSAAAQVTLAGASSFLAWTDATSYTTPGISIGTKDLFLRRDAAGILAQRNLTNAQTLRVYNTFTDASNYERGILDWQGSSNVLTIGTENAGTGSARNLRFVVGGAAVADYSITQSGQWTFSGGLRTPSNIVAGSAYFWTARSQMASPSDGIIELSNNAGTDFSRLQFGGTTSSFPALKRSSTTLAVRLADDSADAAISAGNATLSGSQINMTALPTSDPHVVGRLWSNSGVVTVSAG